MKIIARAVLGKYLEYETELSIKHDSTNRVAGEMTIARSHI